MTARAYLNHGRWISDCPREFCSNAERLDPRQDAFRCSNCLMDAPIEWPPAADDIWAVLSKRPVPQTRNWFPKGHELALRAGCPDGQTVADLLTENEMHGVK